MADSAELRRRLENEAKARALVAQIERNDSEGALHVARLTTEPDVGQQLLMPQDDPTELRRRLREEAPLPPRS